MMEDHFIICRARNHLADALKALLKAETMTAEDFAASRDSTLCAAEALKELLEPHFDALLRQPYVGAAKP